MLQGRIQRHGRRRRCARRVDELLELVGLADAADRRRARATPAG